MIGPVGLPLVVPFAVPVSVLWAGLQKSKQLNLDVQKYFWAWGGVPLILPVQKHEITGHFWAVGGDAEKAHSLGAVP
jgi:hypothetical protein